MSWSDDDFDADAALAEQQKKKKEWDDSEDEEEQEVVKEAPPPPKVEEKPPAPKAASAKKKTKGKKEKEPEIKDETLEDAEAEKLRRRKLEEEQDARRTADLFSGFEMNDDDSEKKKAEEAAAKKKEEEKKKVKIVIVVKDAFDQVSLKKQEDVEELCGTCIQKLEKGKAKGSHAKFMTDLVKALEANLDSKELDAFDKSIAALVKAKKVEKTSVEANKRKTNEKMSKTTKFNVNDELSTMYGGEEDWDEDWDDEQYYK